MNRIVLVLRSGGDFSFPDVRLIADHIVKTWKGEGKPEIICFWDKAIIPIDLGHIQVLPMPNEHPRVWSRVSLYSPELEYLRPFLYIDLDTAIIQSLHTLFEAVQGNEDKWITLEDFYRPGQLATGLVWFPKKNKKLDLIWNKWQTVKDIPQGRMDFWLSSVTTHDLFWQRIVTGVYNFKPRTGLSKYLLTLPHDSILVCFHGKPRVPQADFVPWVNHYLNAVK